MNTEETIRFAIIGCGNVTEKKSGPAFQKVEGAELFAVMRRDAEKLRDYAYRHHVERYTTDYLELLKDPRVDAVYIATPPDMHCFYTLEAARFHKHVYVEKPMARTVAECRDMIAACKKAEVALFVAYYRRAQPKFLKAREMIGEAIGHVRSFSYVYACPPLKLDTARPWLMDREISGGGLLYDVGSHMVNALLFLLGDPIEVISRSGNLSWGYESDDTHSVIMRFQNGVQGVMQLSFCAAEQKDELWVSGERGSVRMSFMDMEPVTLLQAGKMTVFPFEPLEHVQQPYIRRVTDTLLGRDDLDKSGAEGVLTQEILEAISKGVSWQSV